MTIPPSSIPTVAPPAPLFIFFDAPVSDAVVGEAAMDDPPGRAADHDDRHVGHLLSHPQANAVQSVSLVWSCFRITTTRFYTRSKYYLGLCFVGLCVCS